MLVGDEDEIGLGQRAVVGDVAVGVRESVGVGVNVLVGVAPVDVGVRVGLIVGVGVGTSLTTSRYGSLSVPGSPGPTKSTSSISPGGDAAKSS